MTENKTDVKRWQRKSAVGETKPETAIKPDDSTLDLFAEEGGGNKPPETPLHNPVSSSGDEVSLGDYAERAYLEYAMSVVKARALPDVRDGQKPVQRRIMYAMDEMGLTHTSKHVKSAKIVGAVLGGYHPHGDSSVYEAMVRIAQDFSLRYPLVDGQGNFGSRDGDGAAAMRYCFAAGTRVMTDRGLVRIEDIPAINGVSSDDFSLEDRCAIDIEMNVASLKDGGRSVRWVNSGFQKTMKIGVKNGLSVTCTPNEPFLILDKDLDYKWVDAANLKIGDKVCMNTKMQVGIPSAKPLPEFIPPDRAAWNHRHQVTPQCMSNELARFLGYVISDGFVRNATNEIGFTSSDAESMNDYLYCVSFLFPLANVTTRPITDSISGYKSKKDSVQATFSSKDICLFLRGLGLGMIDSYSARVPEVIFRSSKEEVSNFLRAYFEGDGSTSRHGNQLQIYGLSVSRDLLDDINLLLINFFGIVTSGIHRNKNNLWALVIGGQSNCLLFGDEIGFITERKRRKLLSKYESSGGPSRNDTVPHVCDFVGGYIASRKINQHSILCDDGNVVAPSRLISGFKTVKRVPSDRYKFSGYVARLNNSAGFCSHFGSLMKKLSDIDERDYFYAEITSIDDAVDQFVYDLTVENTHAFIANGFVVHNTESRLSAMSSILLSEINMGTVDFMDNYDGTNKEPRLLPARLPILLMNGASGIAVGMACEIPPHNLNEVVEAAIKVIRKPSVSLEEVLELVKGPDFPGGGQITSSQSEIYSTYESGRGSLRMRAKWTIEHLARGQWRIAVHELPHGVSAQKVMSEIEEISNPKPRKGKKSIDLDQLNMKQLMLSSIDEIRDESDKDHPVRIVIEPKSSRQSPDDVMNILLANTGMECSYAVNMTMIGLDGKPQQKGLLKVLSEWCEFRISTVTRRTQHRLDNIMKRIHILEGRAIAFLHIDKIIKVIREADDPEADLIAEFGLSEIQAKDILEIRLRQLARLEGIKIENEIKELRTEEGELRHLLADSGAMKNLVVSELRADAKKFGDDRRTLMEPVARVTVQAKAMVADEPTTILVSKAGWLRSRQGHNIDQGGITWKDGDSALEIIETRTTQPIVLIDNLGRSYSIQASDIPGGKGDGVPATSLIELQGGGKIAYALGGKEDDLFMFAGENGYGFIAPFKSLVATKKAGKAFMTLADGEKMLPPLKLKDETHIASISTERKLLVFPIDEMKRLDNGGKGVQIQDLGGKHKITRLTLENGVSIAVTGPRGGDKVISGAELEKYVLHRARKGCLI